MTPYELELNRRKKKGTKIMDDALNRIYDELKLSAWVKDVANERYICLLPSTNKDVDDGFWALGCARVSFEE